MIKVLKYFLKLFCHSEPQKGEESMRFKTERSFDRHTSLRMTLILLVFLLVPISALADNFKRIVSLKPNITATLLELGAKDRIVGITRYCIWPNKNPPKRVADYLGPKLEAVVALKPDLIITSEENSLKAPIDKLREMGLRVELFNFGTLNDISKSIKKIGGLINENKKGKEIASKIRDLKNNKIKNSPNVMIIIGTRPIVVAGHDTYLNDLIIRSGGNNISPKRGFYPRIGPEELILLSPNVILDLTSSGIQKELIPKETCYKKLDPNNFQPGPQVILAHAEMLNAFKECNEKK